MARNIEITAKTVELAIEKGALELGVAQEDVTVELLESAKSGFLGIGAKPAKYLVSIIEEEPKKEEKKPSKKAEPKKEAKREEKKAEPAASAPAKDKVVVPADGDAAEFLTKVLSFICEDAKIQQVENAEEGTVSLEIVGENLGGIIGRRGETLDALQHLTNLAVNRKCEGKTRIMLDAENYRAKRCESLEKFAHRAASQVLKYKRNKALEPMNAYERHIIHVALQDMENISTSSVGVEPNRRIIINYTGPDARPPRRRYSK